MSTQTAMTLQEYLRNNVQNYYGDDSFPGLSVCAKSGTAEVGGEKKTNAMFCGFVENEEYPIAFVVMIEEGESGRKTCIPVLSQVLTAYKEIVDHP